MLDRYYEFKVDKFFEDYRDNQRRLERLKIEREDALTEFSTDYSTERVTSSNISNPTEMRAKRREEIDHKIKSLEYYFTMYNHIMNQLDDNEKLLVEKVLSVKHPGAKAAGVNKAKKALFCESATVYRQLTKLRQKVAEIVD